MGSPRLELGTVDPFESVWAHQLHHLMGTPTFEQPRMYHHVLVIGLVFHVVVVPVRSRSLRCCPQVRAPEIGSLM